MIAFSGTERLNKTGTESELPMIGFFGDYLRTTVIVFERTVAFPTRWTTNGFIQREIMATNEKRHETTCKECHTTQTRDKTQHMTTKHVAHQGQKNTVPYGDPYSSSDPENVKIGWEEPQKKSDQKGISDQTKRCHGPIVRGNIVIHSSSMNTSTSLHPRRTSSIAPRPAQRGSHATISHIRRISSLPYSPHLFSSPSRSSPSTNTRCSFRMLPIDRLKSQRFKRCDHFPQTCPDTQLQLQLLFQLPLQGSPE
jgi:hypothetical protein